MLAEVVLASLLTFGTVAVGSAAGVTVNNGDALQGDANIAVTKDDGTKTITIAADGLASQRELDGVKTDVVTNKNGITTNKDNIDTNKSNIAVNKAAIETNTGKINKNTQAISANEGSINTNASGIAALKDINSYLGLSKDRPGMKYFRTKADGADASATGEKAIAIGEGAASSKKKAIALGTQAEASGVGAIAIGAETKESGNQKGAEAKADNAVAIGSDAMVVDKGENGIALGSGAITGSQKGMTADDGSQLVFVGGGKNSVAIGSGANARGNSSIALGDRAVVMNDATASNPIVNNGIAIGTGSKTVSENGMAIGAGAKVSGSSVGATAIGSGANAVQENSLAVGSNANAAYKDSVAIGTEAKASYCETVAIGKSTEAKGNKAIALGSGTAANADNVVSIGHNAVADAEYSIVMGEEAGKGMIGDKNHINGSHVVIGKNAGQNIDGAEDISLGFGAGTNVKGNYNIAIGSGAGTYLGDNTTGSTQNSLAGYDVSLGYHANHYEAATSITEATALGANTVARTQSTAVGAVSKATGNGAIAMGFTSLAEGDKSMAIGEESIARGTGNVALGGGSLATAAMASGTAFLTGTAATQVVSVGNGNAMSGHGLRRIVNVADGSADQDAVTVKQLKALQDDLNAQIINAHPGGSSGNAVTYSGSKNEYVNLKDDDGNAVQIKNVKDGIDKGDAVNKGQMDKAVSESKVHYYSVKTDDIDTAKNNFNNDGAVGADSMAVGVIAKATNERSMAVGNHVSAESDGSIAMGVGYKNTNGSMSETKAEAGYQYNTAIGAGAQSAGDNSLAIGTRAAVKQKNGSTTNSSKESIAIGYLAETSDVRGVAMGAEAKSIAKGANAIGDSATASGADSIAIGTNATDALSTNSIAMGTSAKVEKGSSAAVIGNGAGATNAVNANVFGTGSSITNGLGDDKVKDNSLVGNGNQITRNDAKSVTNVTVSGNTNKVQGIADLGSAADASSLDRINITGTGNTVTLSDNGLSIEDVTIMGNDNKVEAALEHDPDGKPLSNIQILGSQVKATLGNSVYLGSGSEAVATATKQTAGAGTYEDPYAGAARTAVGVVTVGSVGRERRIQNVASGLISETSTDAVNGSQLFLRTLPLRFAGDNSTIDGADSSRDKNVLHRSSNQAMSILGGAAGSLSENNIGVVADAANNKMTVKLAKDLKDLDSAEFKDGTKTTTVTGSGVMITPRTGDVTKNVSLTDKGLDNGGNQITNVASGGDVDTNGANIGDIKNAINTATTDITDNLTDKGFGLQAEDRQKVHKELGEDVEVVGDGKNISTRVDGGKIKVVLKNDISVNGVTTGDTTMTDNGVVIKNGPSIIKTGIDAGGKNITRVADGEVSESSKDAVNGSQLYKLNQDVKAAKAEVEKGSNVHVTTSTGSDNQTIYKVSADKAVTGAGESGLVTVKPTTSTAADEAVTTTYVVDLSEDAQKQLAKEESVVAESSNVVVTQTGTNSTGGKEYVVDIAKNLDVDTITAGKNGADGKDGSIGVNGKDGSAVIINGKDGSIGLNGKDGKNGITIKGADGKPGLNGADGTTETRMVYETKKDNGAMVTHEVATMDDGMKYGGDMGKVINKKLNEQVNVVGGISDESKLTADDNIGVVSDGKDNLKVRLSKDLKGLDTVITKTVTADTGYITTVNATTVNATTVTTGDTTMTDKGVVIMDGPSVTKNGVDAGGKTITHVAPGVNPTDAANVGQLNKLGSRVNRVGAGAAALAALHPLDFDPDDKWDVAAGYGNYKDANAVAVGAFYRPNEDTMLSMGGSFGGGENMVNAGISVKLGQGNHVSTSRVAMAKEIKALTEKVFMLESALAKSSPSSLPDGGKNVLFPDVSENNWAYEYVTGLAKKGLVEGYPDGTFGGDRMMTRYEFAAIVYRLMQSGKVGQSRDMDRLVKEFTPELQYIRIDTVSKHKDGTPAIERVRVIKGAKK